MVAASRKSISKKKYYIVGGILVLIISLFGLFFANLLGFEFRIFPSAELQAMEKASSAINITSGQVVDKRKNDFHHVLGIPESAQIRLVYAPTGNHTKQEVFSDIVSQLVKNGWKRNDMNIIPEYFTATQKDGGKNNFSLYVSVHINENDNLVSVEF
jgi:hypothetical protein